MGRRSRTRSGDANGEGLFAAGLRGGSLVPDAHVGYGLPIGGVLATLNAVIPYAVGVDIACRMKMTVLDNREPNLEIDPLK